MAKSCGASAKYFASIDECIPLSIAAAPLFLATFQYANICPGGELKTIMDLEGMRYCNNVNGGLTISVDDVNADYSSLYDIRTISGLFYLYFASLPQLC